jgi:H+/Cl- antiporter ClcA
MTVQPSKKKYKKSKLFIIAVGIALVLGTLAFVFAYGIGKGWDVVAAWFSSKYAFLLYVGVGVYLLFVIWFFVKDWIKRI